MPRFFFHLYDDIETLDFEGCELPDIETAIARAMAEVRHLVAHSLQRNGLVVLSHRIDIADQRGRVLDTVRFDDAVELVID
jgi:hypothetical protein